MVVIGAPSTHQSDSAQDIVDRLSQKYASVLNASDTASCGWLEYVLSDFDAKRKKG